MSKTAAGVNGSTDQATHHLSSPTGSSSLKERIAELENEISLKNRSIEQLEGTIREITPLRRHLKRQVKARLGSFDSRMITTTSSSKAYKPVIITSTKPSLEELQQADKTNFNNHNRFVKPPLKLRTYLLARKAFIGIAGAILGLRKV